MQRSELEDSMREEEAGLAELAALLTAKIPLQAWPERLRDALGLALHLEAHALGLAERWKVVSLRRHLFGTTAAVPDALVSITHPLWVRRLAERIRGDLPAVVPHRAGAYLVSRPGS